MWPAFSCNLFSPCTYLKMYAWHHYLHSLTSEGYQVVVEHLSIYGAHCYPSPIPRLQAPFVSCLLLCPSTQLLTAWQMTGSLCRDIKKPRPLLNEGTLAALCSRAYRRESSAPGRPASPFLSPSSSTSVPSSGGLVRGATWRASPAWFISLAPLPGHSGRPKEPTRLQRASARKPGISWNKTFCRPVKNVLWLAN